MTLHVHVILSLRVSAQSVLYSECVMFLQVGQPASRTCLLYGSCPGQRRRADGSGDAPDLLSSTAAGHTGNYTHSLPWGNPATQDGQTHSLQHREYY